MASVVMPKYYADEDARTITRTMEILQDSKRKKAALIELKKQAKAANAAASRAEAIASMKVKLDDTFRGGK